MVLDSRQLYCFCQHLQSGSQRIRGVGNTWAHVRTRQSSWLDESLLRDAGESCFPETLRAAENSVGCHFLVAKGIL